MPITYAISKNGGILVKCKDHISGSEIKEIDESIYGSPEDILKIKYQLWDFTNVNNITISIEDIKAIAEQDAEAANINPNMTIILVANNDLIYSLGRLWMDYSKESPFKSMFFPNIKDAEEWIDEMIGKP